MAFITIQSSSDAMPRAMRSFGAASPLPVPVALRRSVAILTEGRGGSSSRIIRRISSYPTFIKVSESKGGTSTMISYNNTPGAWLEHSRAAVP
jgi:hypothetical protein